MYSVHCPKNKYNNYSQTRPSLIGTLFAIGTDRTFYITRQRLGIASNRATYSL